MVVFHHDNKMDCIAELHRLGYLLKSKLRKKKMVLDSLANKVNPVLKHCW